MYLNLSSILLFSPPCTLYFSFNFFLKTFTSVYLKLFLFLCACLRMYLWKCCDLLQTSVTFVGEMKIISNRGDVIISIGAVGERTVYCKLFWDLKDWYIWMVISLFCVVSWVCKISPLMVGCSFYFLFSNSQYIRRCSILNITVLQSEQNTAPALLQPTY